MIELVAAEAARTVVGSSLGYFIGKWFGKREQKNRCSFLWDLEMEVSPKLLAKLIDQEVREGCIKPEDADDRLAKILEIRQRYGLLGGADSFIVARSDTATVYSAPQPTSTTAHPSASKGSPGEPPKVEYLAQEEALQELAKREVGPPRAVAESSKPKRRKLFGII